MYVKVRVRVGAKKESLEQISRDHFDILVRQPAERNLANRRVLELIAAHFGIPRGKVRIVSGHHSPSKLLALPD